MAYYPGALDAALAAVVGDEPELIAELRAVFIAGAVVHVDDLSKTDDLVAWRAIAQRLHSLAASFGAIQLMTLAKRVEESDDIDPRLLVRIRRALNGLSESL